MRITVFGANGNVGNHFVTQSLDAGHTLQVFVRNASTYKHINNPKIDVVEGDATNYDDVEKAITDSDVVVSCLGNPKKQKGRGYVEIMYEANNNILNAAAKCKKIPRCILITTIGCGGTSWVVKQMLILFVGRSGFADYERADKRIREESTVPFLLVRPYALTNNRGTGMYYVTKNQKGTFLKPISRADVATFMVDMIADSKWDGPPGVLLGGKRAG